MIGKLSFICGTVYVLRKLNFFKFMDKVMGEMKSKADIKILKVWASVTERLMCDHIRYNQRVEEPHALTTN